MNKNDRSPTPAPETKKRELAAAVRIPIEQAIKTAAEKVPGRVVEIVLAEHPEKAVWRISLLTPEGQLREVLVDIVTGMLVETNAHERSSTYDFKPDVLWSVLGPWLVALSL
jgi:uncharacterized membrane protein YkoI